MGMGLYATIYRNHDTDLDREGDVLSGQTNVVLVNVEGPFEPSPSAPAALVVDGYAPGTKRIVAATQSSDDTWAPYVPQGMNKRSLASGKFVFTSDDRFPADHPLPLHDHFEAPNVEEEV